MKLQNLTKNERLEILDYATQYPLNERHSLITMLPHILATCRGESMMFLPAKHCTSIIPDEFLSKNRGDNVRVIQPMYSDLIDEIHARYKPEVEFLIKALNETVYDYKSLANVFEFIAQKECGFIADNNGEKFPRVAFDKHACMEFSLFDLFLFKVRAVELYIKSESDVCETCADIGSYTISNNYLSTLIFILQHLVQNLDPVDYVESIKVISYLFLKQLNLTKSTYARRFLAMVVGMPAMESLLQRFDESVFRNIKEDSFFDVIEKLPYGNDNTLKAALMRKVSCIFSNERPSAKVTIPEIYEKNKMSEATNGYLIFGDNILDKSDVDKFNAIMLANQIDRELIAEYMPLEYEHEEPNFMIYSEVLMYMKADLNIEMLTFKKEKDNSFILIRYDGELYKLYSYLGDSKVYGMNLHEEPDGNRKIITIEKDESARYRLALNQVEEV